MSDLDKFLEERGQIPIPSGNVARIKLLAKELALGVHRELWHHTFWADLGRRISVTSDLYRYFEERWEATDVSFYLRLLQSHEYIVERPERRIGLYKITRAAFDLLSETEPYNVFVSYKHSESSAFALLVVARLKEHGLMPFCDMALIPGEDWHAELEERIKESDHFIVLIGKKTLCSRSTLKEIRWALDYEKSITPIWHNGFTFAPKKWKGLDREITKVVQKKQAIEVTKESAGGYDIAIRELLTNRFGITP